MSVRTTLFNFRLFGYRHIIELLLIGVALLLLGGALGFSHYYQTEVRQQNQELRVLRDRIGSLKPAPIILDKDDSQFADNLIPQAYLQESLATLHAIETESGLSITNASYKWRPLSQPHYAAIDMQFTAKADYRTIRLFIEKVLVALPFASISEISMKRESIQTNQVDLRCKLSLFLNAAPQPTSSREKDE